MEWDEGEVKQLVFQVSSSIFICLTYGQPVKSLFEWRVLIALLGEKDDLYPLEVRWWRHRLEGGNTKERVSVKDTTQEDSKDLLTD